VSAMKGSVPDFSNRLVLVVDDDEHIAALV
jgi:hypothetical protein